MSDVPQVLEQRQLTRQPGAPKAPLGTCCKGCNPRMGSEARQQAPWRQAACCPCAFGLPGFCRQRWSSAGAAVQQRSPHASTGAWSCDNVLLCSLPARALEQSHKPRVVGLQPRGPEVMRISSLRHAVLQLWAADTCKRLQCKLNFMLLIVFPISQATTSILVCDAQPLTCTGTCCSSPQPSPQPASPEAASSHSPPAPQSPFSAASFPAAPA